MILGVAYYPEHWPEARWPEDARQMKALGLQVVRLAEFAWSRLEPQPGQYQWDWLDRAIDVLAGEGLQIVLGTPTAAPPAWLARQHPEILPVDAGGDLRQFGSRRHYCPNSPLYRQYSVAIAAAMAAHYAAHPALIGWQIDNEFGGGNTARCYCPRCAAAFRGWLQQRYGSLEVLNQAWGAVFWSQEYDSWEQIEPPVRTVAPPNPSHVLDYQRFASDSYVEYQRLQVEALRPYLPRGADGRPLQWITHNFMGLYQDLDQFALAGDLDLATWDSYPSGNLDRWRGLLYPPAGPDPAAVYAPDLGDPQVTGLAHDLTRGLKRAPFWIMEQQCGHINWGRYNPGVNPGATRLWTWHAVASGASAVIYFRWRACLYAQEQYHSGLLQHDASPGVGYGDLLQLQGERAALDALAAEPLSPAPVALLFDFEDLWALNLQPHRQDFNYLRLLFPYYQALQDLGLAVDLVHPTADLSAYRLALAPTLHLADAALAERLAGYVRSGGYLLLGVRSGFKERSNRVTDQPLPGPLRACSAAVVTAWAALAPGAGCELESALPALAGPAETWIERLELAGDPPGNILARYASGPYTGAPALAARRLGQGVTYSLGFAPSRAQAKAVLSHLAGELALPIVAGLPPGLVAARRGQYQVFLNFSERALTLEYAGQAYTIPARDLLVVSSG